MAVYPSKTMSLDSKDAKQVQYRRASITKYPEGEDAMLFKGQSQRRSSVTSSTTSNGSLTSLDSRLTWKSFEGTTIEEFNIPPLYSPPPKIRTFSIRSSLRSSTIGSIPRLSNQSSLPVWKRLPQEVYECIFDQLEALHADPLCPSCATCLMRDLHSLALTSRGWDKAVRRKLYSRIKIVGNDSPVQFKKYKTKVGSRLKLLRRTLREKTSLASCVIELQVPDVETQPFLPNGKRNIQYEEYVDLVASVVMACPNLESLTGFSKLYRHEFDRLTYALSTRKNLKEHMWIIEDNKTVTERPHRDSPGLLDSSQVFQFLQFHCNWQRLETILLYSPGRPGILEHDVFVRTFSLLPSLKHLCLSSFNACDFTNATLLALPALISLRLERLPGVTDSGLTSYASLAAPSLQKLTLLHQNVHSLLTFCKLFTTLSVLEKFTVSQDSCPELPADHMIIEPLLASSTLKHMHWDISPPPEPPGGESVSSTVSPNSHLARSILALGFPSLRTLRSPSDTSPPGALQAVCRPTPNAQILLHSDKYSLPPSTGRGPSEHIYPGSSLQLARRRAQALIDSTISTSLVAGPGDFIRIIVTDHSIPQEHHNTLSIVTKAPLTTVDAPFVSSPTSTIHPRIASPPSDRRSPIMPTAATIRANSFPPGRSVALKDRLSPPVSRVNSIPPSPVISPSRLDSPLPLRAHVVELSFPRFMGRIDPTLPQPPPRFVLTPDIPGNDENGGVVQFSNLVPETVLTTASTTTPPGGTEKEKKKKKRTDTTGGKEGEFIIKDGKKNWKETMAFSIRRDGCTGTWNQSSPLGRNWWGHVERERRLRPRLEKMF